MIFSFLSFFWEHPERKQLTKPGQADLANFGELLSLGVVWTLGDLGLLVA